MIWFNPPFNLDVSTNVAKIFLNLTKSTSPVQENYTKFLTKAQLKQAIAVLKTCHK